MAWESHKNDFEKEVSGERSVKLLVYFCQQYGLLYSILTVSKEFPQQNSIGPPEVVYIYNNHLSWHSKAVIHLHVTFDCEYPFLQRLRSSPFDWNFALYTKELEYSQHQLSLSESTIM